MLGSHKKAASQCSSKVSSVLHLVQLACCFRRRQVLGCCCLRNIYILSFLKRNSNKLQMFKNSRALRSLQCIWHSCPKAALQVLCRILCPVPSDVPCPHLSCALNTSYFRDHLRYLSCASISAATLLSVAFRPGCNLIKWSRSALSFPRACRNRAYSKGMLKVPEQSQSFLCHHFRRD